VEEIPNRPVNLLIWWYIQFTSRAPRVWNEITKIQRIYCEYPPQLGTRVPTRKGAGKVRTSKNHDQEKRVDPRRNELREYLVR
jgi:hypothetical protein